MTEVGDVTIASDGEGERRPSSGIGGQVVMIVTDLVVPVVGFYILRGWGIDALLALILAGLPAVVAIGIRSIAQRKVGALGIFVLAILAGSVLLSFITGSPRFLLAKEGWFTGAIGVGFLISLRFQRPVAFTLARTMVEPTPMASRLQPHLWNELWQSDPRFRHIWRTITVVWGVVMIADAIVRVVIAYALPIDLVPLIAGILWGVTFIALQLAQHAYFTRVGLWRRVAQYTSPHQDQEDSE